MQAPIQPSTIAKRKSQFYTATYPIPYHYNSLNVAEKRVKFLFDSLLAVMALLMLWPLYVVFAIGIKLSSDGPVFCRQRVLGRNGRIFYAYTFRTCYINSHQKTVIGNFLCSTGLKELPLLFNVIKHEMSFVGPRVVTPEQIVKYGVYADRLLSVTPGITGYWQLNGHHAHKRVEQDMEYINSQSLRADISILCKTVTAVFQSRK